MKRIGIWIMAILLFCTNTVYAKEESPAQLYAQSAVLMDADSGRVLFEKNGYEQRPMASTTKIMTCILALENGNEHDVVTVSKNAQRQPKVRLGMQEGEMFSLYDLLYSLMLESHNDSAVAIAEGVGGTVKEFAGKMNQKAKEIGCTNTHFITPNGLDASDEYGKHATTAADLARIMRYCIMESPKKEVFLKITQKEHYSFADMSGAHVYDCCNHNAFLNMMDGALSGKTGFTGEAGYCYVGALRRGECTLIVSLLGCGWPNNKQYKWEDTKKLMNYGLSHYTYRRLYEKQSFERISVKNGIAQSVGCRECVSDKTYARLLGSDENVQIHVTYFGPVQAPVRRGEQVGEVVYELNGEKIWNYPVVATRSIPKKTIWWSFTHLFPWNVKKHQ